MMQKDLLSTGLVVDEKMLNDEGGLVSEVHFKNDTERRIINMDETHHDLSMSGDKSGSRAISYHKPLYQRGANRSVKSARHVTGVYATNAAGEALPPMYLFDSSAKSDDNFRVKHLRGEILTSKIITKKNFEVTNIFTEVPEENHQILSFFK